MKIICISFEIKEKKAIQNTINIEMTEKKRKLHKRKITFWSWSITVNKQGNVPVVCLYI